MNFKQIKVKEAIGKQKVLPKLKTILANPYKPIIKKLSLEDIYELKQLICAEITESGLKPEAFATARHIRLGLQSTFRAIKNKDMSCVLISLAIKPHHIINQIIYYAKAKDDSVPVYCVQNLQEITKDIFGVQALTVVLPSILPVAIEKWTIRHKSIAAQHRSLPADNRKTHMKFSKANSSKKGGTKEIASQDKLEKMETSAKVSSNNVSLAFSESEPNELSSQNQGIIQGSNYPEEGDYISFSGSSRVQKLDETNSKEEEKNLLSFLGKIGTGNSLVTGTEADKNSFFKNEQKLEGKVGKSSESDEVSDSDDFLPGVYQPLRVHKIQPNAKKKPKKKKNKNKKK